MGTRPTSAPTLGRPWGIQQKLPGTEAGRRTCVLIHARTPGGLQSGSGLLHPTLFWMSPVGGGQESPRERPGRSMALQVTQTCTPSSRCGLTPAFTMLLDLPMKPSAAFRALIKSRAAHNFKPDLVQRKHTQIPSSPLRSPPLMPFPSTFPGLQCDQAQQLPSESGAGGIAPR